MITQTLELPYRLAPPPDFERDTLARATLDACKASILPLLVAASVAIVQIDYEGGGDEGKTCHAEAFDAAGKPITLPEIECERRQLNYDGSVDVDHVDLGAAIDNLAEARSKRFTMGGRTAKGRSAPSSSQSPTAR